MNIERRDDEILVRFSAKMKTSKIQCILDYLKYEELSSKSDATEAQLDELLSEAKEGRWEKVKKDLGLND